MVNQTSQFLPKLKWESRSSQSWKTGHYLTACLLYSGKASLRNYRACIHLRSSNTDHNFPFGCWFRVRSSVGLWSSFLRVCMRMSSPSRVFLIRKSTDNSCGKENLSSTRPLTVLFSAFVARALYYSYLTPQTVLTIRTMSKAYTFLALLAPKLPALSLYIDFDTYIHYLLFW